MSLTFSLALFPALAPNAQEQAQTTIGYIRLLAGKNADRIAIRGRLPGHIQHVQSVVEEIHSLGLEAIMYTGAWGGIDMVSNPGLRVWAQRDADGNPLGYRGSLRSGMLCPASPWKDEVLVPEILTVLSQCDFETVFFDIPWFMKRACACRWCAALREAGQTNGQIVHDALASIAMAIKSDFPQVTVAVNASAPKYNRDHWTGGHIRGLAGTCDEYVTEWNPYRMGQDVNVVGDCIRRARKLASGRFSHATTVTRNQELLRPDQLRSLFGAILVADAQPWLSAWLNEQALGTVSAGYEVAWAALAKSSPVEQMEET